MRHIAATEHSRKREGVSQTSVNWLPPAIHPALEARRTSEMHDEEQKTDADGIEPPQLVKLLGSHTYRWGSVMREMMAELARPGSCGEESGGGGLQGRLQEKSIPEPPDVGGSVEGTYLWKGTIRQRIVGARAQASRGICRTASGVCPWAFHIWVVGQARRTGRHGQYRAAYIVICVRQPTHSKQILQRGLSPSSSDTTAVGCSCSGLGSTSTAVGAMSMLGSATFSASPAPGSTGRSINVSAVRSAVGSPFEAPLPLPSGLPSLYSRVDGVVTIVGAGVIARRVMGRSS